MLHYNICWCFYNLCIHIFVIEMLATNVSLSYFAIWMGSFFNLFCGNKLASTHTHMRAQTSDPFGICLEYIRKNTCSNCVIRILFGFCLNWRRSNNAKWARVGAAQVHGTSLFIEWFYAQLMCAVVNSFKDTTCPGSYFFFRLWHCACVCALCCVPRKLFAWTTD